MHVTTAVRRARGSGSPSLVKLDAFRSLAARIWSLSAGSPSLRFMLKRSTIRPACPRFTQGSSQVTSCLTRISHSEADAWAEDLEPFG